MDMMRVMSALEASVKPRFYKYVSDSTSKTCKMCLKHDGEIFTKYDKMPELPLHPKEEDLKAKLRTAESSVEVAAKLLKKYLDELKSAVAEDKLGDGFKKSTLYYMADPAILNSDDKVDMNVPEWLLNTMCAVWNSGIDVLRAEDKIGDNNYRNAYRHGSNSSILQRYLSKLVK